MDRVAIDRLPNLGGAGGFDGPRGFVECEATGFERHRAERQQLANLLLGVGDQCFILNIVDVWYLDLAPMRHEIEVVMAVPAQISQITCKD